jgi:hypothetical protein
VPVRVKRLLPTNVPVCPTATLSFDILGVVVGGAQTANLPGATCNELSLWPGALGHGYSDLPELTRGHYHGDMPPSF